MGIRLESVMKSFRLTKDDTARLAKRYQTPLLVVSVDQVAYNYKFIREHWPRVQIYYAVKANPAECIVKTLAELGACFDVASAGEMQQLNELGINAARMVYANPYKTPQGLKTARTLGVNKFTFDSESEIYKMAESVPNGKVLLRVRVDNPRALVDLNKKFGASVDDVMRLLKLAREAGLDVAGLCFHVGSQSPTATAHLDALTLCRKLFDEAAAAGFDLRILDIGGGLPIPSIEMAIELEPMVKSIYEKIEELFPNTEIWAEPGRYLCGTAVNLLTSVIGTQQRNNQEWYFLDDGLYGTFSGVIFDHWDFGLEAFKDTELLPATFAGPSCDSLDIMFRDKLSPKLTIGDVLMVPDCGAYTSASATEFNGFSKTPVVVWEEVKQDKKVFG